MMSVCVMSCVNTRRKGRETYGIKKFAQTIAEFDCHDGGKRIALVINLNYGLRNSGSGTVGGLGSDGPAHGELGLGEVA